MYPRRNRMPPLLIVGSMVGLFSVSVVYQRLLDSEYAEHPHIREPWVQVALGVLLTLLWASFEDRRLSKKALQYFAASGLPFVLRWAMEWYFGDDNDMRVIGEE